MLTDDDTTGRLYNVCIVTLTLLPFALLAWRSPHVRARVLTAGSHVQYGARLTLTEIRRLFDPAWKRELGDRTDALILYSPPIPSWFPSWSKDDAIPSPPTG